jgi:hypothetical protein
MQRPVKISWKVIVPVGFFILLLVGMGVSLVLLGLNQDVRQQAAGHLAYASMYCAPAGSGRCTVNGDVEVCNSQLKWEFSKTCSNNTSCAYSGPLADCFPNPTGYAAFLGGNCGGTFARCSPDKKSVHACTVINKRTQKMIWQRAYDCDSDEYCIEYGSPSGERIPECIPR